MVANLVQMRRTRGRAPVALRGLSVIVGVIFVNASLIAGWRGLDFFASRYRVLLAVLLSLEVVLCRLLENTNTGVRTIERQAWVGLFGPFWLIFNVASAWTLHRMGPLDDYWAAIGVVLFSSGLALRVWSACTLGQFFSLHVTVFAGQAPITRGPYSVCRHPAYLGSTIQIVGLGFMFHAPAVAAVGLLVFSVVLVFRIRDEEKLMIETFPELYAAYQQRVSAFFPGIALPAHLRDRRSLRLWRS